VKFDRVPAAPSGEKVNFEEIFSSAGMDPAELDRVKKAEELLKGLPPETPAAVKRQIVEASLKAFGFDLGKIVQAAQNQIRAVDAYVRVNETATAKAVSDAQAEIQRLNDKIAAMRADIDKRNGSLANLSAQAQVRKADVQKVIDFFQAPSAPAPQGA
jgi:oligoendopeptidase F